MNNPIEITVIFDCCAFPIGPIPKELGALTKLENLQLGFNKVSV